MFYVGDKISIIAAETDLQKFGLTAANIRWLLNGCEKEVEEIKADNETLMLRRYGLQPVWINFAFARVTKRLVNGQWKLIRG
jgi:hypothetical protein